MIPGILTAPQVAAAYAEMDRLFAESRGDWKDGRQGAVGMRVGHRISELKRQVDRSHVLATHALLDRLASLPAGAEVAPP